MSSAVTYCRPFRGGLCALETFTGPHEHLISNRILIEGQTLAATWSAGYTWLGYADALKVGQHIPLLIPFPLCLSIYSSI